MIESEVSSKEERREEARQDKNSVSEAPFRELSQELYKKEVNTTSSTQKGTSNSDAAAQSNGQLVFSDLWSQFDSHSRRLFEPKPGLAVDDKLSRGLDANKDARDSFAHKQELDTIIRPDGKPGLGTLGANFEQIARAVKRFDPEIWERDQSELNKAANIRNLQASLNSGGTLEPALKDMMENRLPSVKSLENIEKNYPDDFMRKVNSFLIGESANEIMKQAILEGNPARYENEPDRLLRESLLSVKLGHLPTDAEYQANSGELGKQLEDLRKTIGRSSEWTPDRHKLLAELVDEQVGKSEHWSSRFAKATNNGRLACAGFITNGAAAQDHRLSGMIPSLDLNMNGVVGEALLRGFQPQTIEKSLEDARSRVGHSMAFVIRPARVKADFSMLGGGNGHIGFLAADTGDVLHNSSTTGVGVKEKILTSASFASSKSPFVLVPPGW